MITIKSEREIELMKIAGEIVGKTHHYLESYLKPGITTGELDKLANDFILSQGADVSCAIEEYANLHHLGVVKELTGHGIGTKVHEDPDVPNYGKRGTGPILRKGMTIAVEPMLNLGTADIFMLDDDWTIVTADDKPAAHYEHTVLVTEDGYTILTKR